MADTSKLRFLLLQNLVRMFHKRKIRDSAPKTQRAGSSPTLRTVISLEADPLGSGLSLRNLKDNLAVRAASANQSTVLSREAFRGGNCEGLGGAMGIISSTFLPLFPALYR